MKRYSFLLLVALACAPAVHAQEAPAPATKTIAPDALAEDLATYGALYKRGFYDELIYHINGKIESLPVAERAAPDARLLYWRGVSYYFLGWFEEAKSDLLAAQADKRKSYDTKKWMAAIEGRTALLPPNEQEIRDGDRVTFRMHSFGMEGGTAMIMGMLPAAYRVNRQIFGSDVEATTVYVFDDYAQLKGYYNHIYPGKTPASWAAAMVNGTTVLISLRDTEGVLRAREQRLAFQTTVVHEFNHAMLNRLLGTAARPRWFEEGLAQIAGAQVNADYDASKQKTLMRLFRNDALVPMEKLASGAGFYEQTELGITMLKGPDREFAPDSYAQSYGMTKYLLDNISTPQLQSFLNRVRDSEDFPTSFADEFGMTPDQFYERWKRDTARQLAAQ